VGLIHLPAGFVFHFFKKAYSGRRQFPEMERWRNRRCIYWFLGFIAVNLLQKDKVMKDIFVDIVDEHDEVIYAISLARAVENGLLKQIRMVKLFIKNYDKELLLCRNALAKKGDDLFDVPLTAIVHVGESYEEALIRSVYEVFNIDMIELPYHALGKLSTEDGMDCFTEVFELTFNELPDFSQTKFNDFFWEKPLDVITQLSKTGEGEKALSICLKNFYFDCQNNLSC